MREQEEGYDLERHTDESQHNSSMLIYHHKTLARKTAILRFNDHTRGYVRCIPLWKVKDCFYRQVHFINLWQIVAYEWLISITAVDSKACNYTTTEMHFR